MNKDLPDKLRDFIRTRDKDLADRADSFWRISRSILDRQNRVNSNENGYSHVERVEHNGWRLIKDTDKVSEFNVCELFILSCGACSHDFDKGLFDSLPEGLDHGEASGEFLTQEYKLFLQNFHESAAIEKIIGIHALTTPRFQEELEKINRTFSLSTDSIKLQRLAVILKAADILHTDSSRIPQIRIEPSGLDNAQKNKNLAREAISGWHINGTQIIINAIPKTQEHLSALEGCIKYIKETEWPTVRGKLSDYGFPFELEFKIDRSKCGGPKLPDNDSDKTEQPGGKYSQGNYVFNVPYKEKGSKVVGRETVLQKLQNHLVGSHGTAIGQTASFYGMGGLGKTQLAVEYAYRYKASYPNGVIWISADQDIDSQLIQISKRGNWIAPESEHRIILETALRRLTTYSDCLIIFDNVEKFESIKHYLPENQATPHLILTSREPIPGFEPIDIDILSDDESLGLLMMESGRDYDSISYEEKDAAKRIVEKLGGLPLAIEIAGAFLKYSRSFSFENYLVILKDSPSSALAGKMFKGYTAHESDLYRTLKVSESIFEQEPLLKEILDALTWSGSSFMGLSLLSAILDVPEPQLFMPLSFGTTLRIIRKDESQNRYEIHRLLRTVRQEEFSLMNNHDWAETVCTRVGSWFETRREEFTNLSCYESEIDHLKQWNENAKIVNSNQNARLLWLQAYPYYHLGKYTNTYQILESALELDEKISTEDTALKANIISDLGSVSGLLGYYKKALELHERALKIREKQFGPEHPDTANSLNSIGGTYRDLGDHPKALEFQERALKIREKQLGPEHPDTANSLNSIGVTYGDLGDHPKALEIHERALKIREKQLGPEHPDTANSLNNIGGTYKDLGDHPKALELHERALKIREKQLGPEHPDTASSLNNIGGTYRDLGDHPKALEFQERALKIREKQLGPEHPDTANSLNNIGLTYGNLGNHPKALELHERALKIREKQLGPEHPDTANSLNCIGGTYGNLGNHPKALELHERALKIREKQFGPEHPDTANSLNNIGGTYGKLGNHPKALELHERTLEIFEKQLGPEHPNTANSLNNIGSTYGDLGNHPKALEFHERALKILEKQLGLEHPNTANSLNNIGLTYGALGDHRKALEFQERALEIREKQLGPEHPDTANSLNNVIFCCLKIKRFKVAHIMLDHYLAVLPETHMKYNYFESLNGYIDKESVKSGFRPPSAIQANKKKRKGKSRKKR